MSGEQNLTIWQNSYFSTELVFLDNSFTDSEAFFNFAFSQLKQLGYVKDSFLPAIMTREKNYPTALPVQPYAIALPHTDTEHIIKPFILLARLKQPLLWQEMGNDDHSLAVKFIFLLGFTDKNGHISLLQKMMDAFCDEDFIQHLNRFSDKEAMLKFVTSKLVV